MSESEISSPQHVLNGKLRPSNLQPVSPAVTQQATPTVQHVLIENTSSSTEGTSNMLTVNDADIFRYETPDTDVASLGGAKPDITILCQLCNTYVAMRELNEHRAYHKALEVMHYYGSNRPDSVDALLKRRKALLKKIRSKHADRSEHPLKPGEIQIINGAFEILKADLEDTFDMCRQVRESVNTQDIDGLALNCSTTCVSAVGICSTQNERWKNIMEDTRVFQDCYGSDVNKCFLGIYDGHNGHFASEMAASELHHALLLEMEKFDPRTKCTHTYNQVDSGSHEHCCDMRPATKDTERALMFGDSTVMVQDIIDACRDKIEELERASAARSAAHSKKSRYKDVFSDRLSHAFKKAHYITDLLLSWGKDERSRVRWSGCSTLSCVIQNKQVTDSSEGPVDADNQRVFGSTDQEEKMSYKENDSQAESVTVDELETNGKGKTPESSLPPAQELGTIHIANAGNVHAVLVRGNKAYKLTKDHTANNRKEAARIIKSGGTISESDRVMRVNGILATTRGLGNHGDPSLKRCVISEPYTASVPIDQYAQMLVLASNGIWEVFSEHEVANLLSQALPSNHIPAPSQLSISLNLLLAEINSQQFVRSQSSASEADRYWTTTQRSIFTPGSLIVDAEQKRPATGKSTKSRSSSRVRIKTDYDDVGSASEFNPVSSSSLKEGSCGEQTDVNEDQLQPEKHIHTHRKRHPLQADLKTEIGSNYGNISDEDSGNEGDVDTNTDILSLPGKHILTIEEIQREFAKALAERLVHAALMAGARDNITAMVVLLPGCGI